MKTLLVLLIAVVCTTCSEQEEAEGSGGALLTAKRYDAPGIYDASGRYRLLRGVNLNTLGDYWAANPAVPPTAPYEPDHFRVMAGYGFDVVRLLFHWSAVEPEPGQYDQAYIAAIRQAVVDASRHGIYVLLDMHQDAYSKYIASTPEDGCQFPGKGWDGAPDWATLTDGASTCTEGGRRESAPAAYNAWRNFWNNTNGIREACIGAWQEVVKATADLEYVLGYDALNEPALGNGDLQIQLDRYNNYLKELLLAIREAERESGGMEHIFFFETTVGWNGQEVPSTPAFNFTRDHNIVFAPHNYFEVIVDGILTIEQGAELYANLAGLYGTHCFIGEWGVFGDPLSDLPKLERFARAEDAAFMGSTWWQWCQAPGDPHGISWDGASYGERSLHLLEVSANGSYTGTVNTVFLNVLSRARPVAIHGRPLSLISDPSTGVMELKAASSSRGTTELWIPGRFGEPAITGDGLLDAVLVPVEGGYRAAVSVEGTYRIRVDY